MTPNKNHGFDTLQDEKNFLTIGGNGYMGRFYEGMIDLASPDSSNLTLDINHLGNDPDIVRSAVGSVYKSIRRLTRNRIVLLALPFRLFDKRDLHTGNKRYGPLKDILGLQNHGSSNDAIVTLTSSLKVPLDVMDGFSGVSVGIHHMHKPPFDRKNTLRSGLEYDHTRSFEEQREELLQKLRMKLAKQVVVLTATDKKKNHDHYPHYEAWFNDFLHKIGYEKIITDLTPEEHDKMMSTIQFLTHSMYLVAANVLQPYEKDVSEENAPVAYALLQIVKRMLTMPHETYQGIATENEFNGEIFKLWEQEVCKIRGGSIQDLCKKLVLVTQRVAQDYMVKIKASDTTKRTMGTPVSRLRDSVLIDMDSDRLASELDVGELDLKDALENYRSVINHPIQEYGKFFEELRTVFPDYQENESASIIAKYTK